MIVRKFIVVIFVFIKFTETFHLEPIDFVNIESFDGVRSYPVFKVSMSPEDSKKVIKVRMSEDVKKMMDEQNGKLTVRDDSTPSPTSTKHKTVNVDKVRDFMPMSREDIRNLKGLSFHGRSPPNGTSPTTSQPSTTQTYKSRPTQIDFNHRKYKNQQKRPTKVKPSTKSNKTPHSTIKDRKRAASSKVETKVLKRKENDSKFPKNIDKGFQPLMRPSPMNVPIKVSSPSAPSFHTMRNYVDYLKQRQKIFFDALEKDDEILEGRTKAKHIEGKPRDVETEIDYFMKREKELVEEQRPKEIKNIKEDDESSTERMTTESSSEESVEVDRSAENDGDEEETKNYEKFVPFRMYAQVRHVEAENHKPRHEADEPKVKEKLTLEKKNVYYKEEGYDEKKFDHGSEEIDAHYRSKRSRRSIETNPQRPYALALIKKSEIPNLTGEKLLRHLDELISNSELYLPDESDVKDIDRSDPATTIYGKSRNTHKSSKYPYYNLPDTDTLNTMSAFRYSENIKNFPNAKQSLYGFKNLNECQDIEDDVNPVPGDIEVKGKKTSFNDNPKRLKNLGGKINCFKTKIFGKDPFDNPLFKEEYVAASIPIPVKDSRNIPHHVSNPLIAVYDDVISNIRASFAEEIKKQREKEIDESLGAETNRVERTTTKPDIKIYKLDSAPGVARLPIFDINTFLPKFKAPINDDDDDVEVKTKNSKRNIQQDFEMEFIESKPPRYTKFSTRDAVKIPENSIINLRPPVPSSSSKNLNYESRKRRTPIQVTITRVHPTTSSKKKLPHFLQPPSTPNTSRFKLL